MSKKGREAVTIMGESNGKPNYRLKSVKAHKLIDEETGILSIANIKSGNCLSRRDFIKSSGTLMTALGMSQLLAGCYGGGGNSMSPVVSTTNGRVRGAWEKGIAVFRGVRYAAAPVGPLRFRPPAPPERWDGVRDATNFGPVSPQPKAPGAFAEIFSSTLPQGDDCLNLNIWTPDPGAANLPVMVWIHGGGFMIGSGADSYYDGRSFARDGVVCVTINYRLGILGFLHVDGEGAGAYGMLDQIAALRWVQENIASFGGDPGKVTIAGESAGGMAVGLLLTAPGARGLFRRAILQSGAAHHGLLVDSEQRVTRGFCKVAGVAPDDADALRQIPTERLVELQASFFNEVVATPDVGLWGAEVVVTGMPFQPEIGGDFIGRRSIEAVADGVASDIDLLIAHTREEFRLLLGADPSPLITMEVVKGVYEASFPGRGAEVFGIYAAGRPGADPIEMYAALETDRMFRVPAVRLAEAQSRYNPATYFCRLSWRSPVFDGRVGAGHAIDLPFMWDNLENKQAAALVGSNPPVHIAEEMHRSWVSFISSGNPNNPKVPAWPSYNTESKAIMDFGDSPRVLNAPEFNEVALWDGLLLYQQSTA